VAYCQCILSSLLYGTSFSPSPLPPPRPRPSPSPTRVSARECIVHLCTSGRDIAHRTCFISAHAHVRALPHVRPAAIARPRHAGNRIRRDNAIVRGTDAPKAEKRWKSARESPIESSSVAMRARLYGKRSRVSSFEQISATPVCLFLSLSLPLCFSERVDLWYSQANASIQRFDRRFLIQRVYEDWARSLDIMLASTCRLDSFEISWMAEERRATLASRDVRGLIPPSGEARF